MSKAEMLTDDQWSVLEPLFFRKSAQAQDVHKFILTEKFKWHPLGLAYRRGMGGLV